MKASRFLVVMACVVWSWVPAGPYPGRAADAAWRDQAIERINEHRKSLLRLCIVDSGMNPVVGATILVQQRSHAFRFGTAIRTGFFDREDPDSETYRRHVVELFNTATVENWLKWPRWESGAEMGHTQQQTVAAIDWLLKSGLDVRGHNLVWPGDGYLPRDVLTTVISATPTDEEQQFVRNRIAGHIAAIGSATANKIFAWDVLNEPRRNRLLMDYLPEGHGAMADWFLLAEQAAPEAKLFLNEYGILDGGRVGTSNQQVLQSHVQMLLDAQAPVDGVGLEAHFDGVGLQEYFTGPGSITAPEMIWPIIDRYAAMVGDVHITEFDFDTKDEQLQADYTRDFLTAAFAHPAVSSITLWGFWEGAHWRPRAALFRRDWTIKPNGQAYKDLVYGSWWSNEELKPDSDGCATARLFRGEHAIITQFQERRRETMVEIGERPVEVVINL